MMFAWLGPLLAGIGSAFGGVLSAGAGAIGGAASAVGSAAGGLANAGISTLGAGAQAIGQGAAAAGSGLLNLGAGAISTVGKGVGWIGQNAETIANVGGQAYGLYTALGGMSSGGSPASQPVGTTTSAPYTPGQIPVTILQPGAAATIPTLTAAGASYPMTEDERLWQEAHAQQSADTEKFILIAVVLGAMFLFLKKR